MNLHRLSFVDGWAGVFAGCAVGVLPAQSISDFTPKAGTPGDQITITGSGFDNSLTVVRFWNSSPASRFVASSSQINNVVVPANAETGWISVQNPPN